MWRLVLLTIGISLATASVAFGAYAQKYIYVFEITGDSVEITNANTSLSAKFGEDGWYAPDYYNPIVSGMLDTDENKRAKNGIAYDSADRYQFEYVFSGKVLRDLVLIEKLIPVNDSGELVGDVQVKRLVIAADSYKPETEGDTKELTGQHVDEMSQLANWVYRKYQGSPALRSEIETSDKVLLESINLLFSVNQPSQTRDAAELAQREALYRNFSFQNLEQSDVAEGSAAFDAIFDTVHNLLKNSLR